jgi:hypothetical protein
MSSSKKSGIEIEGLVALDKRPCIKLFRGPETIEQLTVPQARQLAYEILTLCARTEADAQISRFFAAHGLSETAAAEVMQDFRYFRVEIDADRPERKAPVSTGAQ